LRKKGEAIVDSKYGGKRASRNDLYGDDDSEEEDDDDDSEIGQGSADEEDEEVYEGEFADLLGPAGTDEESNQEEEQDSDAEDQDDEEEDEESEEEEVKEEEVKKPSKKSTAKQQDEKVMMKELKQAASADVEKGRDVKKQLVSHIVQLGIHFFHNLPFAEKRW